MNEAGFRRIRWLGSGIGGAGVNVVGGRMGGGDKVFRWIVSSEWV